MSHSAIMAICMCPSEAGLFLRFSADVLCSTKGSLAISHIAATQMDVQSPLVVLLEGNYCTGNAS